MHESNFITVDTTPLFRNNPLYGGKVSNWGQRMKKGGAVIRRYQSSRQVKDPLAKSDFQVFLQTENVKKQNKVEKDGD